MSSTVTIGSGLVVGVDAVEVAVEATARNASDATPRLLGLVDACVREAYHRVLQAFHALDLPTPRGITTVNFAPAALKKHGSGFDLPLALALAGAAELFPPDRARRLFAFGEISLRGAILPARGAVSIALAARRAGAPAMVTGLDDAALCTAVPGIDVRGAGTLADAIFWLAGRRELPPPPPPPPPPARNTARGVPDLADLRGLATPKRALATAAAGGHNLLLTGPPGTGKTALVRRMPGILPPPAAAERLEIVQVHAAAGLRLPPPDERPLRAPHHTSSTASLLGGGCDLRPGEVSLAHRGVLFLDELPEFRRDALEAMRQPLEDGSVTVGRALRTATMPARVLLVAAMNPCPCGFLGHPRRPCLCPPPLVQRYRRRLSGPLLDRLDLQIEVPSLDPREYHAPCEAGGDTDTWRAAVLAARTRQVARNPGACANAELDGEALHRACAADGEAFAALDHVVRRHRGSGRLRVRLLRVARTLADLRGAERITAEDVLEAAAMRSAAVECTQ